MFDKILIANRGEIAVRIIRACQELGVATVAVHSQADREALHTFLADQAVEIGPPPPTESYLDGARILEAARRTGCQAIHPGYGFLAENPAFAQAVQDAGLVFIGPDPEAMRVMGSKTAARAAMQAAGVPVIPGFQESQEDAALLAAAQELGFPVLVKAVAGGGGKGMRFVDGPAELPQALESARREAQNAFGDPRIYLEKALHRPRHVEFQILGDRQGRVVHLFERECSVQRRHQKIVEETPSPLLDQALRQEMGQAAVAAAQAVGYVNAGTVEFLVDEERRFHFLEMNTRLQVEHPITEMVTGLDLVKLQLRIAAGEPIPFRQEELSQRGHALECRIYAEDPAQGFLPALGRVLRLVEPTGPGVRVDSGITSGDEVSRFYDPMLAKLIVLGQDRAEALARMQRALQEYAVLGEVITNIPFLQDVIAHPVFQRGEATTDFVERHFPAWQPPSPEPPDEVLVAGALAQLLAPGVSGPPGGATAAREDEGDPYSPWRRLQGFRL